MSFRLLIDIITCLLVGIIGVITINKGDFIIQCVTMIMLADAGVWLWLCYDEIKASSFTNFDKPISKPHQEPHP